MAYLGGKPVGVIEGRSERGRGGAERGKQHVSPFGKVRRGDSERSRGPHRSLFVEHPTPFMSVEGMHEKSDRTEEATGDIEGVTAGCPFTGAGKDERRLPLRVANERFAQPRRIQTSLLVQGSKLAAEVGKDVPKRHLTGIGVGVHPQRVAGLGTDLEVPALALLPDAVHPVQVAVDPVDAMAIDGQPGTTVHPRSPAAWLGYFHRLARQLGCQQAQSSSIQRRPVVQAQIEVGIGTVRSPCPAASQAHTNDTAHIGQPIRDLHHAIHEPQSPEADHHPRPNYVTPAPDLSYVPAFAWACFGSAAMDLSVSKAAAVGLAGSAW